jgi:hypothetical protein
MTTPSGNLFTDKHPKVPVGLYSVKAVVGNVGTPGAPIVHYALTVQAASGHVSGLAELTQAVPPPNGTHRFPVTGRIYQTGLGKNEQLVSLEGQFTESVPPPAIGTYLVDFKSALVVDQAWNGHGGFSYQNTHIDNVPVRRVE